MTKKKIKKIISNQKHQYIFIAIITLTLLIGLFKITFNPEHDVYVKIKVSQGLWWAKTTNPYIWLANNIQKGDIEKNLLGKPVAEIMEVRKYPAESEPSATENTYTVFIKTKLKAKLNKNTHKYTYNRSTLVPGSPIEFSFSHINLTGTILEVSDQPIEEKRKDIIVEYVSVGSFVDDYPYIYTNVIVGDQYHDGEAVVFEVLDKYLKNITLEVSDDYARLYKQDSKIIKNIVVKAKINVIDDNGTYIFGEERVVNTSNPLIMSTKNLDYKGFVVADILDEDPLP